MAFAEPEPTKASEAAASSRGDRWLLAVASVGLALTAIWFWAGNGIDVFSGIVSAGLALCF